MRAAGSCVPSPPSAIGVCFGASHLGRLVNARRQGLKLGITGRMCAGCADGFNQIPFDDTEDKICVWGSDSFLCCRFFRENVGEL